MHRLRRGERSLRRAILLSQSVTISVIGGLCTFCVIEDPESLPLIVVFAVFMVGQSSFVRDFCEEIRRLLRARRDRIVLELFPETQQTSVIYDEAWEPVGYRGFPRIPIFTPEQLQKAGEAYRNKRDQIPDHILKRVAPERPTPPEQQARRLLWSLLDSRQRAEYAVGHKFKVPLTKGQFISRSAIIGDGYVHWPDGAAPQCVHPQGSRGVGGSLPLTDSVVAQLLYLRNNPQVLFRMR